MKCNYLLFTFLFILSGCNTVPEVQSTKNITVPLSQALQDVITSLDKLNENTNESDFIHGLMPAEVDVTFAVTVTAEEGKSSMINVIPGVVVSEVAGLSLGRTTKSSEVLGNTITVKLKNVFFTNSNQMLTHKSASEMAELFKELRKLKITAGVK